MKNQSAHTLLTTCSNAKPEENILIVTDRSTMDVALLLWDEAENFPNKSIILMEERTMHGENPPALVAAAMKHADIIFGCTKFSLFHSDARREAVKNGARFVNMADYALSMMKDGGLTCDFEKNGEKCSYLASKLENKKVCQITTKKGTNFQCSIEGIAPTPQYARSLEPGSSSSPPDIECATCAVEGTGQGTIVVDASIPHPRLGLIREEITLTIEQSRIVSISGGEEAKILEDILESFQDENAYNIGEIGIGLNDKCQLNGRMLEDEGCDGTLHFGAGDNLGFGGKTSSKYHLDIIIDKPTLTVDGETLIEDGKIVNYQ